MKLTTKIIVAMVVAITVSLLVCILTHAEEADTPEEDPTYSSDSQSPNTEEGVSNNGNINEDATTEQDSDKIESTPNKNVFEIFFLKVKEYSAELFCILTFISSLALAFAYKKGLLPFIQSTLVSFGSILGGIKDHAEGSEKITKELSDGILTRLECAETSLESLALGIGKLAESLDEQKTDKDEREKMRTIIGAQIEMLYDIFMSSSLPQYQKDAVGERISKMKEALGSNAVE